MADERVFPDVDFVETDPEVIAGEIISSYEEKYGRRLGKADPMRMLILWFSAIIAQERSYINIAAKRNLPRYATGEYLDSLSEIFYGIYRKTSTPATTTSRFTLPEEMDDPVDIPEGTEITNDGTITFATTEASQIPAGSLYADVPAECTEPGTVGNGWAAGTITNAVTPIAYGLTYSNLTETAGGMDDESDDELYTRGRESYEGYSTAGTIGAYVYHVKEHNPSVRDVVVRELNPGQVGVTMLMNDGLPSADAISDMQEYLSSDEIRPLGDQVIVSAPEAVSFSVELTYYASGGTEVQAAVESSVSSYIEWQTGVLGRRINPDKLIANVIRAGADRVEITQPLASTLNQTQCAVLSGTPILTYGGEDT